LKCGSVTCSFPRKSLLRRFITGRRLFLLFLKPIINGTRNYYLEAQTRDARRTDVIVDYSGLQFIIEMKIWHGEEYNRRGEEQQGRAGKAKAGD